MDKQSLMKKIKNNGMPFTVVKRPILFFKFSSAADESDEPCGFFRYEYLSNYGVYRPKATPRVQ